MHTGSRKHKHCPQGSLSAAAAFYGHLQPPPAVHPSQAFAALGLAGMVLHIPTCSRRCSCAVIVVVVVAAAEELGRSRHVGEAWASCPGVRGDGRG